MLADPAPGAAQVAAASPSRRAMSLRTVIILLDRVAAISAENARLNDRIAILRADRELVARWNQLQGLRVVDVSGRREGFSCRVVTNQLGRIERARTISFGSLWMRTKVAAVIGHDSAPG
jgi:hypothetical protein